MWRYLGTVACVAALLATGGCSGSSTQGGTPGSASASASASPAVALLGPVGLAQAPDGAVWAAWSASDVVAALGPDGRPTGEPVPVGDAPLRMVALGASLWVTTIRGGGLAQVDPATHTVVRTVTLGGEPEGLTTLGGHLFVVLQKDAALAEVDPADGRVLHRYPVGGAPREVVAGTGALFVGDFEGGRVARVTPGRPGSVTRSKTVCAGAQDLLVRGATVWVACMTDGTVVGLDAATLTVTHTWPVAGDPDGLAEGTGSALLVSLQDGPGLAVLDPTDGNVQRVFHGRSGRLLDQANNDVLERDTTAFVSDYTGNRVSLVRLDR